MVLNLPTIFYGCLPSHIFTSHHLSSTISVLFTQLWMGNLFTCSVQSCAPTSIQVKVISDHDMPEMNLNVNFQFKDQETICHLVEYEETMWKKFWPRLGPGICVHAKQNSSSVIFCLSIVLSHHAKTVFSTFSLKFLSVFRRGGFQQFQLGNWKFVLYKKKRRT